MLDYDRSALNARKRRRDLVISSVVLAGAAGVFGYFGFCCCGLVQTGDSPSVEERVQQVLTGLVVAALVVGAVVITGGMREAAPPSEGIEDAGSKRD